jgi:ABC-type lipoprotein export system ATPase subunit
MNKTTITLTNVTKQYKSGQSCFAPFSYQFTAHHTYALTGPSGCGKTTLLTLISTIEKPSQGTITWNPPASANNIYTMMSFIPQKPLLLDECSCIENVMIKHIIQGNISPDLKHRAHELLALVNLSAHAHKTPRYLSGGEKQRLSLARALLSNPTFIIADEPTAHVDKKQRDELLLLLQKIHTSYHTGMILATHDPAVASAMDIRLSL